MAHDIVIFLCVQIIAGSSREQTEPHFSGTLREILSHHVYDMDVHVMRSVLSRAVAPADSASGKKCS